MDTKDMRCLFREWRKTAFPSPASSFSSSVVGAGGQEGQEREKEGEPKIGGVEAAVAAAAIEEGVKVRFLLYFSSLCIFLRFRTHF